MTWDESYSAVPVEGGDESHLPLCVGLVDPTAAKKPFPAKASCVCFV